MRVDDVKYRVVGCFERRLNPAAVRNAVTLRSNLFARLSYRFSRFTTVMHSRSYVVFPARESENCDACWNQWRKGSVLQPVFFAMGPRLRLQQARATLRPTLRGLEDLGSATNRRHGAEG
jgi:hypothetical protein